MDKPHDLIRIREADTPYHKEQYFKIRDFVYQNHFNLPSTNLIHDGFDELDNTDILVALHENGQVVGGARVIFRFLDHPDFLLPFENEHFKLIDALPELTLANCIYCEVDRTVALPDFRHLNIGQMIVGYVTKHARSKNASYLFTVSPPIQARNNRMHCHELGIPFSIRRDVKIPDHPSFNGKKMFLTITVIDESIRND